MSEQEFILKFIAQQVSQLHDDFRADLAQVEGRLTERIAESNASVREDAQRIASLETYRAHAKGFITAISAVIASGITLAGIVIHLYISNWSK